MKSIKLTRGEVALVDDEDFECLSERSWYCAAYSNGNKYARTTQRNGKKVSALHMHRLIMNPPHNLDVDHINGNGLDNRKENLRVCTRSQNHMNRRPYKKHEHGLKGVSWCGRLMKWHSFIRKDGKTKYLGQFDSAIEAARRYNDVARQLFGEFARLNPI